MKNYFYLSVLKANNVNSSLCFSINDVESGKLDCTHPLRLIYANLHLMTLQNFNTDVHYARLLVCFKIIAAVVTSKCEEINRIFIERKLVH